MRRPGLARTFNRLPMDTIALIAGISSSPSGVSEYSTEGGDVGITRRSITPFSASFCRRALSTFAEITGMSARNSPKRRAPLLRLQITSGVQAPPSSDMHSVSGHSSGAGDTLLFLSFSTMAMPFCKLSGYRMDTGD
jgi:hypothetical protein